MKLFIRLISPFILLSCSDLTPEGEEAPAPAPLAPESVSQTPKPSPAPAPASKVIPESSPTPASTSSTRPGPENPLGFLDPDTTGELMTEAKKKTLTSANSQLAPPPEVEGDSAIEIPAPKLPEIKD